MQFPNQTACIFIRNTSATDSDDKIPELRIVARRLLDLPTVMHLQLESDGHPIADAIQSLLANAWRVLGNSPSGKLALVRVVP